MIRNLEGAQKQIRNTSVHTTGVYVPKHTGNNSYSKEKQLYGIIYQLW